MAELGLASRREADDLIDAGKVRVNGVPAVKGMDVDEHADISIMGAERAYVYAKYYKPRGVLTHSPAPTLFHLGRLDKDSEGLLLLTDDRRLTDRLLSPTRHVEKTYEVEVLHPLPTHFASKMSERVQIGDAEFATGARVEVTGERTFTITLTEGKNRQIRRMCGHFGVAVTTLTRVRFGPTQLGNLKPGEVRPLTPHEVSAVLSAAELT